jgi:protein-S-isoprenylcysteine O-methyltransferase Ste14
MPAACQPLNNPGHSKTKTMVALGNFFFRYRNRLFPLVFLLILLLTRPEHPFGNPRLDIYLDGLGVVIALLGQTLRALTLGYDDISRAGRNQQIHANHLLQEGVFAHSRNPLYLGNFLIAVGLALILNAREFYMLGLPFILLAYVAIIAAEEDYLQRKFGARYEAYRQRVNRLWPDWKGFRHSIEGMTFNWKRVVSQEFNTACGLLAGMVGLRMWSLYYLSGQAALPEIRVLAVCLIPVAMAYGTSWFLKKTGRLS